VPAARSDGVAGLAVESGTRLLAARVVAAGAGGYLTTVTRRAICAVDAPALRRTNFRGRTVSLAGGPALAVGASAAAAIGAGSVPVATAALAAGLGAGAVGWYDDLVGGRPGQQAKGFRGHLAALREGRITSGLVKVMGVGAAGLIAAGMIENARAGPRDGARDRDTAGRADGIGRRDRTGRGAGTGRRRRAAGRRLDTLLAAAVIAGSANLVNLLDLRPGRALKVGLAVALPLAGGEPRYPEVPEGDGQRPAHRPAAARAIGRARLAASAAGVAAGLSGAALALLPADLREEVMLGDAGANALGALLGTALVARTGRLGRAALLVGITGLTAASEKISFTRVIEATPVLRELDTLGRRR
jgi:UDP-N-acetylmuramyl pentapeptide phosphotransferase/UDP-N-acetylglucosamine-1-phosphate transferase